MDGFIWTFIFFKPIVFCMNACRAMEMQVAVSRHTSLRTTLSLLKMHLALFYIF